MHWSSRYYVGGGVRPMAGGREPCSSRTYGWWADVHGPVCSHMAAGRRSSVQVVLLADNLTRFRRPPELAGFRRSNFSSLPAVRRGRLLCCWWQALSAFTSFRLFLCTHRNDHAGPLSAEVITVGQHLFGDTASFRRNHARNVTYWSCERS